MPRTWLFLVAGLAIVGCESDKGSTTETTKSPPHPEEAGKSAPPGDSVPVPPAKPLDVDAIGKAAGTEAKSVSDGGVRIGWARTDVETTVDGMVLPPAAGLGSWAAFAPVSGGAMVMGDTVVFQDEINPAIDAAFAHGLQITALHNHFVFDDPQVYFMHIGGRGDPVKLAAGVKAMWDAIKAIRKAAPKPARTFGGAAVKPGELSADGLAKIIGRDATAKPGGVVKFVVERKAEMGGLTFAGNMGLSTWAAFTGDEKLASIDGDFAMTAAEVQPVLHALRGAKINIVAVHNHMIGETPGYFFVHYWGTGPAADLARGFRAVLDAQAKVN